jgi:nucleotide-binding universal stress UspA family protein
VRELKAMFEGVYFDYQLERIVADARSKLAQIVAEHGGGRDILIEEEVRFGSIAHEILAAAKARDADLIVMASHRPEMRDYLIGPNAAHVVQRAECSVLVLRRFEDRPG